MATYIIANHCIQVSDIDLNRISGFKPFVSTRSAGKEPILQLQTGVCLSDWNIVPLQTFPFEAGDVICDFAVNGGVYLFRMRNPGCNALLMEIRNHDGLFSAITNMNENTPGHLLRFGVWISCGIAAIHHQTMALHASTICYKGKSILFLGESGTGKSTHTRLWLDNIANTGLLNDDSPFVRIVDNTVVAFGSPWSGKTPCYKNQSMPVAAIVRLSQAPYNKITPLKGIASLGALLPSCPPAFTYDDVLLGHISNILSAMLKQVPVYSLACLPNPEAAHLVLNTLQESGRL